MTPSTVAHLIGIGRQKIPDLIAAGVFRFAPDNQGGRVSYIMFDPARDISSYVDEWAEGRPAPTTHAEFALYRKVRTRARIWAGAPHCDHILEAVFQKLKAVGNYKQCEVRGLIPLDDTTFKHVSAWLGRRMAKYVRERHSMREEIPVTWEMFAAALPPQFADLPRTFLDRKRPLAYDRPPIRVRQKVWRLDRLFDCGALYALVYVARMRRPDGIMPALLVIARVEEILTAHAPTGPWTKGTYQAALRRYALDQDLLPDDTPAVRDRTVRFWSIIVRRLHRYRNKHDRRGAIGLLGLLPPTMVISLPFRRELATLYGNLRAETLERRKRYSNEASAKLDTILDAAENRRNEVRAFGNAMRAATERLAPNDDRVEFPVEVPILDELGRHEGGLQIETFRLLRLREAWRSLDTVGVTEECIQQIEMREKRGYEDLLVVEHLGTVGCDGAVARPSWIVAMSEVGALMRPGFLAVDVRERRHELLVRLGLPGVTTHSRGTLTFDRERGCLACHGLRAGRTFVALAEIERAIRYGHLALDIVSQSLRRGHEVRQLLRLAWLPAEVIPGKVHFTQDVWPKVEPHIDLAKVKKVPVTVLAATVDEALDLCELHVADCDFDRFPEMMPVEQLRWKCPPGEYIMSHDGRAFHRHDLNLFLRVLLAGWPPFTLHDFRYAGAEDAEFDDEPAGAIQVSLGHRSEASTRRYRSLSAAAQAVKDARTDGRREDNIDRRAERRRARDFGEDDHE